MTTLNILIGDDSFASRYDSAKTALSNMFVGMAKGADYKEAFPIRIEQEGDVYIGKNIVPYVSEVRVKAVPSVDELLVEAEQGKYDLVVTDLQYGAFGDKNGRSGGERVIDALQGKQTLALCTSSTISNDEPLREKVEILVSPGAEGSRMNKFEFLGWKLSQFYAER